MESKNSIKLQQNHILGRQKIWTYSLRLFYLVYIFKYYIKRKTQANYSQIVINKICFT